MAQEGLFVEIRAIQKAEKQGVPVKRKGLRVKHNGEFRDVNIEVVPINPPTSKERYFLVLFEDAKPQSADEEKKTSKETRVKRPEDHSVSRLNHELAATEEYLRSIIEEQEATNEELKSANEEILSSNEELQSTNEELETAKEELQSTNEELTTVNDELQNRNFELSQFNNDLNNLLSSVDIPIIMVESNLCIRRFTPMAEKTLNLIPADIGRSISDINPNIDTPTLEQLISDVIETVTVKEQEVQDRNGRWYSMRIRPYRTAENGIAGAVIMLVDVSERRQAEESLGREADLLDLTYDAVVVRDMDNKIIFWNRGAERMYGWTKGEVLKESIHALLQTQFPKPINEIESELLRDGRWEGELVHTKRDGTRVVVSSRRVLQRDKDGKPGAIMEINSDITARRLADEMKSKEILLKEIHHRVKNNLQVISSLLNLQSGYVKDAEVIEMFKETQSRIRSMSLIHEQLYKNMELVNIDFGNYIQNLIPYLFHTYGAENRISLKTTSDDIWLNIDTVIPCGLIVNELVSNSLKHAFPGNRKGEVYVGINSMTMVTID
ncbi:MAG: PAS domain-containing protein [Ignavibacteriales bacterium]